MTNTTSSQPPRQYSAILAGALSLIPGLGHLYLRKFWHGIAYFLAVPSMLALTWWAATTHEFEPFPGMLLTLSALVILFWLWNIAQAVLMALDLPPGGALGLILALAFTYLLGWQAIEVNLDKFFGEFPDTFAIMTRVMWPWDEAVQRDDEITIEEAQWDAPCVEGEIPEANEPVIGGPWVSVSPTCGDWSEYIVGTGLTEGTLITIQGEGFRPNQPVEIWWVDALGNEYQPRYQGKTVNTISGPDGSFEVQFAAPQDTISYSVDTQVNQIQARQLAVEGAYRISDNMMLAVNRMLVTIFQALMATTFGIVFAIPLSFFASRNLMWGTPITRVLYYLLRFILNVSRSIEPIIYAVIAAVWVGLGPFAGVIALTVHTISSLAKLYSEAIESIEPGPIEAISATGANRLQVIVYGIIPQVIPPFLSFTIYRWDINVRMSTIIGFVGGGGIGQVLFQWINQTRWKAAGIAVWLIAATVTVMDYTSSELRKRFV